MGLSHEQVVRNFAARKKNRAGKVEWHGSRVYCTEYPHESVLYSYGRHFPLAVYIGEKGGKPIFLKNGDKYSSSTSAHQSEVQSHCKGPTVSRTAVEAAGFDFTRIKLDNVVAARPDYREYLYRTPDGIFWKTYDFKRNRMVFEEPFTPPRQGMYVQTQFSEERASAEGRRYPAYSFGYWHILGAVVLKDDDYYYLCSLDENQYFVSRLARPVTGVQDAFKSLKPAAVLRAERRGRRVLRQGEWFFISTGMGYRDLAGKAGVTVGQLRAIRQTPLPRRGVMVVHQTANATVDARNQHVCRQYFLNGTLATGRVYHRSFDGRSTGEHKTLDLGEEWFEVHENTELDSWASGGRVD